MASNKLNPKSLAGLPPGKYFDGNGLYLHVKPTGKRYWRHKVYHEGREVLLAYGSFPEVSLKEAREHREESRVLLRKGVNPNQQRKEARQLGETFKTVALEYMKTRREGAAPRTIAKHEWLLSLLAPIHAKPLRRLTGPDILAALKKIEADGRNETAHRASMLVGRVFKYALAAGKAEKNPAAGISFALSPVQAQKHPAITDPRRLSEFLVAVDGYQSQGIVVRCALRLLPHVFLRSSEIRCGKWSEVDWDAKVWRLPETRQRGGDMARTKTRDAHEVPLSTQAIGILQELYKATGPDPHALMFPSPINRNRPISDMAMTRAMRLLGFSGDECVPHGFRSTASTLIRERGIASDACIERQLNHRRRGSQAHYDRSVLLRDRRKMMQAWSDYLEDLKSPAWLRLQGADE